MKDEVILNQMREDGMRAIRVRHEGTLRLGRYVPAYLTTPTPSGALRHLPQMREIAEFGGGRVTEITYPVLGVVMVKVGRGWRELFMVHRVWGTGLRDCIRLGVDAWMTAAKRTPGSAFVRRLPEGVESGVELLGCLVFEADWMPEKVVAVGL